MRKTAVAVLAAATAALAFAASVPAADSGGARAADRAEIEALMWRYIRALDSFDADAYAGTYTPDGQFGTGKRAEVGRDALRKMITDVKKSRADRAAKGEKIPQLYHVIANHSIEFVDADHALYHAYWMTMFVPPPPPAPAPGAAPAAGEPARPSVAAVGRSIDELVRLNGHWLIKKRDVAPQD